MSTTGFRIVGTKTVSRVGFLDIQQLSVTSPSGSTFDRIAVRHPGAVAVVPITGDGVVLIRQYRAAVDEWLLEIPAGKLDHAGEAPLATAHRELEEEIGVRAAIMEPVGEFYTTPGFSDELMYLYAARELTPASHGPVGPEEEAADIVTVARGDLASLLADGAIRDAKTLVGLWWAIANEP